ISVHEFTIGEIKSIDYVNGGIDNVDSGDQDDILIGGAAGDTLDAGNGDNVVIGDHGQILMVTHNIGGVRETNTVEGAAQVNTHPLTYALITSIVPTALQGGELGGADTITTGIGRDIIIGGAGADTINAFASKSLGMTAGTAPQDGNNIVFGDYG